MKKYILIIIVLLIGLNNNAQKSINLYIPQGWRTPTSNDVKEGSGWQFFIKQDKNILPYFIKGDFNGDGNEDFAWLLIKSDNTTWGLFAFIKNQNNNFTTYLIGHKGSPMGINKGNLSPCDISECIILKAKKGMKLCIYDSDERISQRCISKYNAIGFRVYEVGQPQFFYFDNVKKKFISYWDCDAPID